MSFISKIIEKKKKKEYALELEKNHIILSSITLQDSNNSRFNTNSRVFLCLVRALLIFLAAFGTVGSATSAFELNYNALLVIPASIFVCIYIAFIYYNKKTFYIGYIIFFALFTFSIFNFYWYVNSGYQAFINSVYEKYSDYFKLQSTREATEFISNRTLTVSITMIFVVAFLALLLNITISGYMSMIETFIVTFPLIQIGLYIDEKPKLIYVIMLLGAYITILILGRGSHFKIPDIGKKNSEYMSIKNKRTNVKYHSYSTNGTSLLINTILSLLFVSIFLIITNAVFYSDTGTKYVSNKLKNTSDEYIKNFVQSGPWSFFDRYAAKGGLSKGMLGGVSSIRPDYETDLEITFVPQSTDTIYLKSYIGTHYAKDHFYSDKEDMFNKDSISTYKNMYSISDYSPLADNLSKMEIKNIDADTTYSYLPYYAETIQDEQFDHGVSSYTTYYYPYEALTSYSSDLVPSPEYEKYVHNTYLEVPENNKEFLETFIAENDLIKVNNNSDIQRQILSNAVVLKKLFAMEYSYTMAPGSTPRNQDFVEYFLEKQKRGFCAHFAASSTLILRELNIPARYVEGYCVPLSSIADGTAISDDVTGWVGNSDKLANMDTGVVSVEISDGSAHAWVEIYIDGYGWIPYDFTPPSSDDTVTDFNFSSLFSGLFMTLNNSADQTDNAVTNTSKKYNLNLNGTLGFVGIPFITILCALVIIYLLYKSSYIIKANIGIKNAERNRDYNKALSIRYSLYIERLNSKNNISEFWTLRDFRKYVNDNANKETFIIKNEFYDYLNQALYSNAPISLSQYQLCIEMLNIIKKELRK